MTNDKSSEISELLKRRDTLAAQLALRERQLALCVHHLETGKNESDELKSRGSVEESRLRNVLTEHDNQLVHLVRELYELANAERVPGVVAHDARSRVFRRCALVYELLGEDAFREADEQVAARAGVLDAGETLEVFDAAAGARG